MNIVRYIRGWAAFVRTFRMMRSKRHGAGRARLIHCLRGGACSRALVDGQFRRPPVFPRFISRYKPLTIHRIDSAPRDGTAVKILAIDCWVSARYGDGVGWVSDDPLTYDLRTGGQPIVHPEWWRS